MGGVEDELREQNLVAATVYLCGRERKAVSLGSGSFAVASYRLANVGGWRGFGLPESGTWPLRIGGIVRDAVSRNGVLRAGQSVMGGRIGIWQKP